MSDEDNVLRCISRCEHIGASLHTASVSTLARVPQKELEIGAANQPLSGDSHRNRISTALNLLEQGEPLERIILNGG